jgi:hypothetical protein
MEKVMRYLVLLLMAFALPASAEWVQHGSISWAAVYHDPSTIKKNGRFAQVWELQDLKQRHKDGELSRLVLVEYDCKNNHKRIIALVTRSNQMGGGETLSSDYMPTDWNYSPPDSVAAAGQSIVCK